MRLVSFRVLDRKSPSQSTQLETVVVVLDVAVAIVVVLAVVGFGLWVNVV